eukprot:UN34833
MQKVFQKNNDEELLTEIANTLSYFAHEEHTLADHAQRCAFDLASQLRVKFLELCREKDDYTESERLSSLICCLKRMISLKKAINVRELIFDKPFKTFLANSIISEGQKHLCPLLLQLAVFDLWWLMCDTDFEKITESELENIRGVKNYLLENLSYGLQVMSERKKDSKAREEDVTNLIISLCELLIVLKPTTPDNIVARSLDKPLNEDDMNNILRIFATRFETLSEEDDDDEISNKVLQTLTHCIRLCLSNPRVYGRFGALAISQLNRFSLRC